MYRGEQNYLTLNVYSLILLVTMELTKTTCAAASNSLNT